MKIVLLSLISLAILAAALIMRLKAGLDHHPNADFLVEALESWENEAYGDPP